VYYPQFHYWPLIEMNNNNNNDYDPSLVTEKSLLPKNMKRRNCDNVEATIENITEREIKLKRK